MTAPEPDAAPDVDTLGTRLAASARELVDRRTHRPVWTAGAAPVLARAAERPEPADRFRRVEQQAGLPALPGDPEPEWNPLGATVTDRLPPGLRAAGNAMRVRTAAPDAVPGADAVTSGDRTSFRDGAFRPDEPAGLGLVAHEAAHVEAAGRPGAAWRRSTAAGRADEERWARTVEREAVQRMPVAPPPPAPAAPAPSVPDVGAPQAHPMAAATDRDTVAPPPPPVAAAGAALSDAAYRELLRRLRVEIERGG
ncbi:eCIS core domain-containing protein [Pseudonocardia endophytica]|uniref:Uncharacterized protein DUF4157 n=1 Tax=Pseudonocardia endophytica TaxID=401976 RepID=A0A4R1HZ51_PSEEN|nr:DUF4157 domain-containing protein [Pseudonocardia endophytica]TCK22872.1 uncharacterized protein DUF4157 [Pseudonocardia endophytica]